ncbi:Dps family protein [Sedimentitalea nanhaiensis]|uniref:Starvation-inducible DNA-binding protein n=1 Tax=Sedimentitalea nanhaiensis TaxID=999627 RepID=A0A1I7BGU8_9RHOB|nr:DNA starvation/stationary phase protection protein [Sedimentitalea nanhaiensis]SFT86426.1 starvation-inducible DNA-binding protein [Sedimentitalea nanhaiensis]
MKDVMETKPSSTEVQTGVRDTEALAKGLTEALADTYRLVFKTHAYHWNVTGPLFYSIHKLTEEQYQDMFGAADVLAERIRALGQLAPMQLSVITQSSEIEDLGDMPTTREMIQDLVGDHERMASRMHELVDLAGAHKDAVTDDLATSRAAFHEHAAWMLRAIVAD